MKSVKLRFLLVSLIFGGAAAVRAAVTISPSGPVSVYEGETIGFGAQSSICNPTLYAAWYWTYPGGSVIFQPGPNSASSGMTYYAGNQPGDYTISVYASCDPRPVSTLVHILPISVTVNPAGPVPQRESIPLVANVTGSNKQVTWAINDPAGGSIHSDYSGATFTAGTQEGYYTLTATSVVDTTKSGSVVVRVLPPPSVTVSPSSATVGSGASQQFTATVQNTSNTLIDWSVVAAYGGGNITDSGLFTALGGGGNTYVEATLRASGIFGVAPVTVVGVTISPAAPVVDIGTGVQLRAVVGGSSNQMVNWTTTVPSATISSQGYLLVSASTPPGTYSVKATTIAAPVVSSSVNVSVHAATVGSVVVSPAAASVAPSGTLSLSAQIYTDTHLPHPNQTVTWTASSPATIDGAGNFHAPALAGSFSVTAKSIADPTKSATAMVTVPSAISVTPEFSSLSPGSTRQFNAVVLGLSNSGVAWSVRETGGGTVTSTGLYSAPTTAGTFHVIAKSTVSPQLDAVATITVGPTPTVFVEVSPDAVEMARGGTRQFAAAVEGAPNSAVTWAASDGTIDAAGLFTAPNAYGSVTITARSQADGRATGTAVVVVSDGSTGQVFAYDPNGNMLSDGVRSFEWDAENRLTAVVRSNHRSEFAYDGNGRRVLITERDSGSVTSRKRYIWVGNQIVRELISPAGAGFASAAASTPGGSASALVDESPVVQRAGFEPLVPAPPGARRAGTTPTYQGSFDAADCATLSGWAWDMNQPDSAIAVDIYDGNALLATSPASLYSAALASSGKGNGYHAFSYAVPSTLKNGVSHSLSVRYGGTYTALSNSPRTLTCAAPPPPTTLPPLGATYVSQGVPTTMLPGGVYSVSVTFQNSGSSTWTKAGLYRLGDATSTPGTWNVVRADLSSTESVSSGQSKTFTFNVLAPSTAGTYNFQWRMVQENVAWFGDLSPKVSVTVSGAAPRNASYVSQTVPSTVTTGASFPVSITMRNTGSNAWTLAGLYRLGDRSVNSPAISWGTSRADLTSAETIGNGQAKTFSFTATAPATPGTYKFQWQMVQENVAWFGDLTPVSTITVAAPVESVSAEFYPGGYLAGGASYSVARDSLGSVRRVYDSSGAQTSAFDYDPWGRLTVTGGSVPPTFGYAGYFYHQPSGLWLTKYRAYDPDLGRWISPDPILERGGRNLYAYVGNRVMTAVDGLGLSSHLIPVPYVPPPQQLPPSPGHILPVPRIPFPMKPSHPGQLLPIPKPSRPPGHQPGCLSIGDPTTLFSRPPADGTAPLAPPKPDWVPYWMVDGGPPQMPVPITLPNYPLRPGVPGISAPFPGETPEAPELCPEGSTCSEVGTTFPEDLGGNRGKLPRNFPVDPEGVFGENPFELP